MIKCVGKAWLQSPPGGGGRAGSVRRGEHHGLPVAGAETAKLDGASCAHRARRRRDVRHVVGRDAESAAHVAGDRHRRSYATGQQSLGDETIDVGATL